jgi:hypothetical protein
MYQDFKKKY